MELKKLVLKRLVFNDVYEAAEIIKKLKVDVNAKELECKNDMQKGIIAIKSMLGNSKTAQKEINNFLGHLFGMSGKEFGNLPLKESFKAMKMIKESEDLADFFTMLDELM